MPGPPARSVRYRGCEIIPVGDRFLWLDPYDPAYIGCSYAHVESCRRVIDGYRKPHTRAPEAPPARPYAMDGPRTRETT